MNNKTAAMACMVAAVMLTACDEDTDSLGIVDTADLITTSESSYSVRTASLLLDSVVANSNICYLGEVQDIETQTSVRAEFITQFHTLENYTLPDQDLLIKNSDGQIEADSAEVRLYFTNYYGSFMNPMKMAVYELDADNILREDEVYYSDINLDDYLPQSAQPLATKTFTPIDFILPEAERYSTSRYNNIRVRLPKDLGTRMLRAASEHPEWFKNSWQFIHRVMPGLCFKLVSGTGTMLELDVSAMNIFFRYRDAVEDTVYQAVARFSATAEVIQSTRFQNSDLSALVSTPQPYTYLKSPAGIATELSLPVDEIFQGHEGDSINRARLILTRLNSVSQSENTLPVPQNLLLVRKQELYSFFQNHSISDGETSFTTPFDATYNTYTFNNLSQLISYLHREKMNGMEEQKLTSEQWNTKYPDWNKVVVTPVSIATTTSSSGTTFQSSVSHDFSLTSTRLVGGTEPLQMQVIYSGYQH